MEACHEMSHSRPATTAVVPSTAAARGQDAVARSGSGAAGAASEAGWSRKVSMARRTGLRQAPVTRRSLPAGNGRRGTLTHDPSVLPVRGTMGLRYHRVGNPPTNRLRPPPGQEGATSSNATSETRRSHARSGNPELRHPPPLRAAVSLRRAHHPAAQPAVDPRRDLSLLA